MQSDKAAVEITSRFDGEITALHYAVGQMARVGAPLIDIDIHEEEEEDIAPEPSPVVKSTVKTVIATLEKRVEDIVLPHRDMGGVENTNVITTPAVRRIAKENNVNLDHVKGTGKDGRIMKEDVLLFLETPIVASKIGIQTVSTTQVHHQPTPSHTIAQDSVVGLSLHQKAMFKQMTKSLTLPHFGFSEEIIMTECSKLRESINASLKRDSRLAEKYGIMKISVMPILMKAMCKL